MKKIIVSVLLMALICVGCGRSAEQQGNSAPSVAEASASAQTEEFDPGSVSLKAVDSSCFSRVGYDGGNDVLVLEFRESGALYAYYDFSQGDYDRFLAADSLGSYFNEHIKNIYACNRID